MSKSNRIPEKKLAEITDRQFMIRYNSINQRPHISRFHRDDYFMIGVVTDGHHSLSVDFKEYEMYKGNAVIISPGQIHSLNSHHDGKGFVIGISPELMTENNLLAIRKIQNHNQIIQLPENDLHDLSSLFEIIQRRNKEVEVELALISAIKSIVIKNIKQPDSTIPGRYLRLVIRFQQMIEQHVYTVKSPTEYASMLHVSGVYLNEAVKAITGKNVSTIIGEYVTTLAKRELCYTNLTAQEIAINLGYEDYSYFSRLFKRFSGMSPKTFREKYSK